MTEVQIVFVKICDVAHHQKYTASHTTDLSEEAVNIGLTPLIHLLHKLPQALYVVCRQAQTLALPDTISSLLLCMTCSLVHACLLSAAISNSRPSPSHVLAQSLAVTLPISAWQARRLSLTAEEEGCPVSALTGKLLQHADSQSMALGHRSKSTLTQHVDALGVIVSVLRQPLPQQRLLLLQCFQLSQLRGQLRLRQHRRCTGRQAQGMWCLLHHAICVRAIAACRSVPVGSQHEQAAHCV
jgi:hypothetical protein